MVRLRACRHLAALAVNGPTTDEVCTGAVESLRRATQADAVAVLVLDEAGGLRVAADHGIADTDRQALERCWPWRPGEAKPSTVWLADVALGLAPSAREHRVASQRACATAYVPTVYRELLLGALVLVYTTPRPLSDAATDALETIAYITSLALMGASAHGHNNALLLRERAAREGAETANRAKDDFLAMLAHELRNPLGAIVNAVGVLDRTSSQDAAPMAARALVRRQTEQLVRLLDDLLDVARISRGHFELRTEVVDLREVIGTACDAQRHRIEDKGQRLTVAMPDLPVTVVGDRARLQQIVANVVSNACKYTPPAGSISVMLTASVKEGVIHIRDTGRGVPPDKLEWIFEPFTRAAAAQSRAEGGLGLGLTVVKRLVQLHAGTVHVTSAGEGAGAEVTVRLPLSSATEEPKELPGWSQPLVRRILVVEDDPDVRCALASELRLEGHAVHEAATGRRGIALACREQPDAAVIDIGLPNLNGYAVARRIRRTLGRAVYLIALTGYGRPEDRTQSAKAGFDAHLIKPVAAKDISDLLHRRTGRGTAVQ